MPSVSVVIPCYKYAHFLPACVESVLSQKATAVRVLIIDDASPDNSAEVGAALAAADRRVTFRRHAVNRGHIATYNEGLLGWADAEYSLLLSADDLLTPGSLARTAQVLGDHPEVGLVYGRQILFRSEAPPAAPLRIDNGYRIISGPAFIAELCTTASNPVNTPTAVVRTRLLAEIGGYTSELPHTGDLELWLRCALRGSVAILEAEQAYKRMHGANMQLAYTAGTLRDLEGLKAAFDVFFQQHGDQVPDREQLHSTAMRVLGERAFWAATEAFERSDLVNCQALLAFSLARDPNLPSRPEWSRFRWKQRFGARLWSLLRPFAQRLRRPVLAKGVE